MHVVCNTPQSNVTYVTNCHKGLIIIIIIIIISLKPERWGSPLIQKKYREEKACDRRHTYRIITIIIITTIIKREMLQCCGIKQYLQTEKL